MSATDSDGSTSKYCFNVEAEVSQACNNQTRRLDGNRYEQVQYDLDSDEIPLQRQRQAQIRKDTEAKHLIDGKGIGA
jgi:hypothetical protein